MVEQGPKAVKTKSIAFPELWEPVDEKGFNDFYAEVITAPRELV